MPSSKVYVHKTPQAGCCCVHCDDARREAAVLERIRLAVAEEREASAKVADQTNQWVGDAIRARGRP